MTLRSLALIAAVSFAPSAFSGILLRDNYNSNVIYNNGDLDGQDGYSTQIAGTNFRRNGNVGVNGSGGVLVNTDKQTGGQGYAFKSLDYTPIAGSVVLASVDVTSLGFAGGAPHTSTSRFGFGLYNGSGDVIARLAFKFSGGNVAQASAISLAGGGTTTNTAATGTFGDLINLQILLDTDDNIALFAVNSQIVGFQTYTADDTTIGKVALYDNATGHDIGAYDNLRVASVQVVPEPATLAALGLGFVALARRRRRG